jgi:RHS repeat-associated protein
MALKSLLVSAQADSSKIAIMDAARSGPRGFTLAQVSELAGKADITHELIFRSPGQPIPVPSVVNWKLNHYAAIIGERDGLYHIQDPTFASGDAWLTREAIDAEASGYFLVPAGTQKVASWRTATPEEARRIYGMGGTSNNQPGGIQTKDNNLTCPTSFPMCQVNAKTMLVSLNLNDTPVGYQPQKGPSAKISLTYNQREASQPANFSFFNISPKWTLNVLSWVQDNPTSPGQSVLRYATGGGSVDYSIGYSYSSASGAFSPERQGQAVLVRIPATGPATSYELRMPDGSKQVFARSDGATVFPRRMFLSQMIDPTGKALTLNYDEQLRLVSLTDATGRNTTFSYEFPANHLLVTKITDPFGRHAELSYDTSGRLASITDVIGITSSFKYDAGGLINEMATPYGTQRFTYGQDTAANTRFLEMTDPMGFTERLEFRHLAPGIPYNDPVAPTSIGAQNIYLYYRNTFHWDKNLYPITHTDYTQARIIHWLHNPAGQTSPIIESTKQPLERRVWNVYPGQGSTILEGTSGTPIAVGRVLDDGSTQARTFTYNSIGKPLTATDPGGRKTSFAYAPNDIDLISIQQTTGSGQATLAAFTYNSQHLPLTATDAAGKTTSYTYNTDGQVTGVTDALGQTTRYTYDGLGRLISITNADNAVQHSFTYDAFDRVATATDSEGRSVAYEYDAIDRVTQIIYPDGTSTQNTYDLLDLVETRDRMGRITSYSYDANRRMTAMTNPLGQVTSYSYYRNGVLRSITDGNGNTTHWDIDIQSRPVAKVYADDSRETYTYDSASRLISATDALGQTKQYGYTKDDRLAALSYSNALHPTPNVSFTYDSYFPRKTAMIDGVGTTQFQYGAVGSLGALKLAAEDGPYANDTVSYQYDALGRMTSRTVDAVIESFTYDRLDRVTQHGNPLGSFSFSYLGQTGQLLSQQAGVVGTQWSYEDNSHDRRLKSITNSGLARSFQYATTPENQISTLTETVGGAAQKSWHYAYDAADRLLSAQPSTGGSFSYGYDAADNLTSINGAMPHYNNVNQLTSFNSENFSYDGNGNLKDDSIHTYQWDAENRLLSIGYKNDASKATAFRYDGMGRRLAIIETNGGAITETRYLWCGARLCQARTAGDAVTRRYYPQGMAIPQGGTLLYYGTDHLGSVRDVMAAQNGAKVASYDYDPYGNQIATSGRISVDFRYAGMFYHQQSGLYLTNFRAYDPKTARWLSRDPIREKGGLNLYSYVAANPIKWIDPSGKAAQALPLVALPNFIEGGAALAAFCATPAGWVPCGGAAAAAAIIGGTIWWANSAPDESDEKNDTPPAAGSCPQPEDIKGKTPQEIDDMMKGKGWKGEPTSSNNGTRYPNPDVYGEQVRVMPPDPYASDPVKRGPYGRISTGGKTSPPIPLSGNPTLNK